LYSFTGGTNDGSSPNGLVQASDGNFYGMTYYGGANGEGTVFQISTTGALTTLYSFTGGNDGSYPTVGLVQGSDGNLYGTTSGGIYGGQNGFGTVFSITLPGPDYTTNNGTITITGYNGPIGAVIIPGTINGLPVTTIGTNAFWGCSSLTSVTIPSSVTSIRTNAFAGCTSLISVYCEGNAPGLGSGVFYQDDNATVYYLAGTTGWGATFGGLPAMLGSALVPAAYVITNGTITITHYTGSGGAVIIPETISGLPVTSIGDGAFFECTSLTSVTIPSSVTSIGADVFFECTSLTSVTIPGSVTSIGVTAFYDCADLTSVYFGGNAPTADSTVFNSDNNVAVYYLPGTTGWSDFSANTGLPVVLWNPVIQTGDGSFGISNNRFGFNITGTANIPIMVEACTNLASPVWTPLQTLTLTSGPFYFSDPQWTNYPARYYRISSPPPPPPWSWGYPFPSTPR
jgi:uncharacterized repeat protein (TIGR03803 family)